MTTPLKEKILSLLEKFSNKFKKEIFNNIYELIEHEEYGIALEEICNHLYENDITIENVDFLYIEALANRMKLSKYGWDFLKNSALH